MFGRFKKTTETNIVNLKVYRAAFWRLVKGAQDIVAVDPMSCFMLRFAPTYATGELVEKMLKTEINASMKLVSIIFE